MQFDLRKTIRTRNLLVIKNICRVPYARTIHHLLRNFLTTGFSLQIPESNRRFFVGLVLLLVVKVSSVCTVLYQWCYKAAPVLHVLYDSHDTKGRTVQTQNVECTEHQENVLRRSHQTVFKIDNPPHDHTRKCGRELIQLSQKTRCHPTFFLSRYD